MKKIDKTWLFLMFVFGISYLMAGVFLALGWEFASVKGMIMTIAYMFTPALSVIIVEKLVYQEEILNRLLVSFQLNWWFLAAVILPPILAFLTFSVSLLLPGVSFAPGMEGMFARYETILTAEQLAEMKNNLDSMPVHPVLFILLQGLVAGVTINAFAGFGEELGWRGFLVRQFEKMKFWKAAGIIGFIWGIWHAPIILMGHNYPQHPVAGVFMMTVWCILLSPLFLYITIKSKSVIAASILHGTINATGALSVLLISGGNDLLVGLTGLAGMIALAAVVAVFIVYDSYISREKVMQGKVGRYLPALSKQNKFDSHG